MKNEKPVVLLCRLQACYAQLTIVTQSKFVTDGLSQNLFNGFHLTTYVDFTLRKTVSPYYDIAIPNHFHFIN